MTIIKKIFCANDQIEQPHELSAAPNGEITATCVCGRVLKFAANISKEEFEKQIAAHKVTNEGQVTQESIEKTLTALADDVIA